MVKEKSSRFKKRTSVKRTSVKRTSVKRTSVKRTSVKRTSVKLKRNDMHTFGVNLFLNNKEIGHFDIDLEPYPPDTYSAKIGLDDDQQKKGYSKLMVQHVCRQAIGHISPEQKIYIGADSSEGYWRYLGFVDNDTYDNKNYETVPGAGYELMIPFEQLCKKVGVELPSPKPIQIQRSHTRSKYKSRKSLRLQRSHTHSKYKLRKSLRLQRSHTRSKSHNV